MDELYDLAIAYGDIVFQKNYRLHVFCKSEGFHVFAYDAGAIRLITIESLHVEDSMVTVYFADGRIFKWSTKWISAYNFSFGIAVSFDGKYVFVQTWENGLFCLDAQTGEKVWRTKSKRGITNVFVNEDTLLIHQHERALQLADIHTGKILQEKRPATAYGFDAIDHKHIVCQVTAKRWEIIDTETLETKIAFSHHAFTNGHEEFCVNHISLNGQELTVRGFQNIWDTTVKPVKRLPNLVFEHKMPVNLIP